ncbi:MAG: flagellar biosynthetic protein FliQ [Lysobacteraceae bacterium]|nr:MAG: flagellar biosynthetic protein FliQ [Xanthomonadaceae bacterium]
MDSDLALRVLSDMLLAAATMSAPLLLATLAVGLLVSIVQVVTQIQEMTLTFVPKLIVVIVICMALGGWMLSIAVEFSRRMFEIAAGLSP